MKSVRPSPEKLRRAHYSRRKPQLQSVNRVKRTERLPGDGLPIKSLAGIEGPFLEAPDC